jgi:hypothetical protein
VPELRFENIGRGSLAYRTQFDPEDPGITEPNPALALTAFLGAKFVAKASIIPRGIRMVLVLLD